MRKGGFTLWDALILVILISVIAALLLQYNPHYNQPRRQAKINVCINNLRLIDKAKQQWGVEHQGRANDVPKMSDLKPYLAGNTGIFPNCPDDLQKSFVTSYTIEALNKMPTCKIVPADHILP